MIGRVLFALLFPSPIVTPNPTQEVGTLGGTVIDKDLDRPLAGVTVSIVELPDRRTTTSEQGTYTLPALEPGVYSVVFAAEGYFQQIRPEVVIRSGVVTPLDAALTGDFSEMEDLVVEDVLRLGGSEQVDVFELRLESPALLNSVTAEDMSRAGASDAASALRLAPGASLQNGKSAVIRGLPDRYVSSQLNGVRLPSADEDKRAVELDQFSSVVLERLDIFKTFTPDQQGDASGGAVDVRLRGVPNEWVFQLRSQVGFNSQVTGRKDFLTYEGGGVSRFGKDGGGRDPQLDRLGSSWDGAVGVTEGRAPVDSKWSAALGGKKEIAEGFEIGAFASFFYERDSSFQDEGRLDRYWVENGTLVPETRGAPESGDFLTNLFDVSQASESVQWGGLFTIGARSENHSVGLTYLFSHSTEDTATLATDTRGKEHFFPGYDPEDPFDPGNGPDNQAAAPYLRLETLEYTERKTGSLQLAGNHRFVFGERFRKGELGGEWFALRPPELDWVVSKSFADQDQPDKRIFGSQWVGTYDGSLVPPTWSGYKPSFNFTLGNLQRIWKTIEEESDQHSVNLKLPYRLWKDSEGFVKTGLFNDVVDRRFDQDTFSNFGDNSSYSGDWDEPWSDVFPNEDHPILDSDFDVDYKAQQQLHAWYLMADLPVFPGFHLVGGTRYERTKIGVKNLPEDSATWFPPGETGIFELEPGDADVEFASRDALPSLGFQYSPWSPITLRGAYAETVARQTFKELTPILQQEYLGGPIFIGNPNLEMSQLQNYDLRLDVTPFPGSFASVSWFKKDVEDAIEYVQRDVGFSFTTAVNYPKGRLRGLEYELRQDLGQVWGPLEGLSVGANATRIGARVRLSDEEIDEFVLVNAPIENRDMTNAPDHLYNFNLSYAIPRSGTTVSVYYTLQGTTLLAGAGVSTNRFVPSLYAKDFETLNLNVTQRIGEFVRLQFAAKNLTNPKIETFYRSKYIGPDQDASSFQQGVDYSLAFIAELRF